MRNLERNKRRLWYCLYESSSTLVDEDGNDTGEPVLSYSAPVGIRGNVSAASGDAQVEQFGVGVSYDKVIQLPGTDWPIDERSLLFVDEEPTERFEQADATWDEAEGTWSGSDLASLADYAVVRVSVSLNHTSIAARRIGDG